MSFSKEVREGYGDKWAVPQEERPRPRRRLSEHHLPLQPMFRKPIKVEDLVRFAAHQLNLAWDSAGGHYVPLEHECRIVIEATLTQLGISYEV